MCSGTSELSVQHGPLGLTWVTHPVAQLIFYASLLRGEGIRPQDPSLGKEAGCKDFLSPLCFKDLLFVGPHILPKG